MGEEQSISVEVTLSDATKRAMELRVRYQELEREYHKEIWPTEEDMLAFTTDIGALGRLVMAAEGRWTYEGDVAGELKSKMAECLWWILVLSDRLDVDISTAYDTFINKRTADLA
ncbi:MAG TPA: MazG-like protein [Capsulimonadaceae bacterium]|jgi:hypothetical protein